jgi:molybdopterin/thiamine biosynthesis adenylyltransferase
MSLFVSLLMMIAPLAGAGPAIPGSAAPPGPAPIAGPVNVRAVDTPNDGGKSITVTWQASPEKGIEFYDIQRAEVKTGIPLDFASVGKLPGSERNFTDASTDDAGQYTYRVVALRGNESGYAESNVARSYPQWFNLSLLNILIGMVVVTFLILYFIYHAARGKKLFIRRIAGLDAVEESVGRATEMGKPIVFISGIGSVAQPATISAMNILGEVAKKTAQYDTALIVPNFDPMVYTVAREVVKEAHAQVGRPDTFKADNVFYLTSEQFAYAAAVDGIMVREKPATIFMLGYFAAEALVLAETGATTGAIQIAGTDAIYQLPFFITACDYTLIGEELYAASAYLSRQPLLLGSLVGQDYGKLVVLAALALASLLYLLSAIHGLGGLNVVWNWFSIG